MNFWLVLFLGVDVSVGVPKNLEHFLEPRIPGARWVIVGSVLLENPVDGLLEVSGLRIFVLPNRLGDLDELLAGPILELERVAELSHEEALLGDGEGVGLHVVRASPGSAFKFMIGLRSRRDGCVICYQARGHPVDLEVGVELGLHSVDDSCS